MRPIWACLEMSMLAVVTMPLVALLSWLLRTWYVERQIGRVKRSAPDLGKFSGSASSGAVGITATVGAYFGFMVAWRKGRRNERMRGVRVSAWMVNGVGLTLRVVLLVNHFISTVPQDSATPLSRMVTSIAATVCKEIRICLLWSGTWIYLNQNSPLPDGAEIFQLSNGQGRGLATCGSPAIISASSVHDRPHSAPDCHLPPGGGVVMWDNRSHVFGP